MTAGIKSFESWLSAGSVPTIVYLASQATPAHTKVAAILGVVLISAVYTIARTWLKLQVAKCQPATPKTLGQLLDSQFPSPAAGGKPTSPAIAPKLLVQT